VERAESRDARSATITMDSINEFARMARQRLRREDGTFRRSHIQSLLQRAEVGVDQIVIRGSALKLLQTLTEVSGGKPGVETAAHGVRSFVPNWLRRQGSNLRPGD
jgi:site-specific DNA recombinase